MSQSEGDPRSNNANNMSASSRQPANQQEQYVALYNLNAPEEGDLDILEGETLHILNRENENWWLARSVKSGQQGFVPSNYVAPVEGRNNNQSPSGRLSRDEAEEKNVSPSVKHESINRDEMETSGTSHSALLEVTPTDSSTRECTVRPKIKRRDTLEFWEPPKLSCKRSSEGDPMSHQDQRCAADGRDDEQGTDMWKIDTKDREGQHQVYPNMLVSHTQQNVAVNLQVENVSVSGANMPVFLGPVVAPTFHIHKEMPTKGLDQHVDAEPSRPQGSEQENGSRVADLNQVAGDKTEEALKTHYRTRGSYVQLLPGVHDDQTHITGIYTKLQMKTREGGTVVKESRSVRNPSRKSTENRKPEMLNSSEYDAIFQVKTREGDLIKRLIFYGMGGLGKSTFIDKVAYDWALGTSDVLRKYKLVLVLKMCALDQTSDLIDSIFEQLLGEDSGIPKEALRSFIQENQGKVLILLDGFDELKSTNPQASFGSILKALNRQTYRECCICVTTRTSHLEKLLDKSLVQNPCTHMHVLGFSEQDVKEYVHKFYPDEHDSAEALIKSIAESSTLTQMSMSPMLLLLMCLLWRENDKLPETTSRIYSESIDHMFTRKGVVNKEDKLKVILAIGKISLQGLLADNNRLSFAEDEFPEYALDLALTVGILTRQRVFKNLASHKSIQFIHKTMQEYCASKYLQSIHDSKSTFKGVLTSFKYKSVFEKTLDSICSSNHGIHYFEYLLLFCCGDNDVLTKAILTRIIHLYVVHGDDRLQKLILRCYFEGQSDDKPPQSYIDSLVKSSIFIDHETDIFLTLVHFLRNICRPTRNPKLTNVEHIHFERISSVNSFAFALRYMENLNSLTLKNCSLLEHEATQILMSLNENALLAKLDFSDNLTLGGKAAEWAPKMKCLTNLKVVTVKQCNIQMEDIEHISKSVAQNANLTLDLAYNSALRGMADVWSPELRHMKYIEKLVLSNCSLLGQLDIEHIVSALCDMTSLSHLDLSGNSNLGRKVQSWCPQLCRMKHLKTLVLRYCSLCCQDIEHIAKALCNLSNLKQLDLSSNSALGCEAYVWSSHLHKMDHLEKLVLNDCSLGCSDVEWLFHFLHKLKFLDISHNSAISSFAKSWSRDLPKMRSLKSLVLRDCALQLQDLELITNAVACMIQVNSLELSFNRALGVSVSSWTPCLHHMRNLRKLDLSGCLLKCADIKHIALAVGSMSNLVELHLSFTKILGGSASLWSPHLLHMKHLTVLVMANCSLQCADVEHIALSVSDMAKVTELNLSDNSALSESAELWCRWLSRKKHLTLVLRGCSLDKVRAMRIFSVRNVRKIDFVL